MVHAPVGLGVIAIELALAGSRLQTLEQFWMLRSQPVVHLGEQAVGQIAVAATLEMAAGILS